MDLAGQSPLPNLMPATDPLVYEASMREQQDEINVQINNMKTNIQINYEKTYVQQCAMPHGRTEHTPVRHA